MALPASLGNRGPYGGGESGPGRCGGVGASAGCCCMACNGEPGPRAGRFFCPGDRCTAGCFPWRCLWVSLAGAAGPGETSGRTAGFSLSRARPPSRRFLWITAATAPALEAGPCCWRTVLPLSLWPCGTACEPGRAGCCWRQRDPAARLVRSGAYSLEFARPRAWRAQWAAAASAWRPGDRSEAVTAFSINSCCCQPLLAGRRDARVVCAARW